MTETNLTVTSQLQSAKVIFNKSCPNMNLCYQRRKCASGCLVSYVMNYTPDQLIHGVHLAMEDFVLNSKPISLCASSEMYTAKCPQDVDAAKFTDTVKITALHQRIKPVLQMSFRHCLQENPIYVEVF